MGELLVYLALAAVVWAWPFIGAALGFALVRGSRRPIGAAIGFVVGCIVTLVAYAIATGGDFR